MFGNSRLGFGCMRLPMVGEAIDHECFAEMVDVFLAAGGRYFDTAHVYHKEASETAIKAALTDRYPRERYILTDKLTTICFEEEKDILPLFQAASILLSFHSWPLLPGCQRQRGSQAVHPGPAFPGRPASYYR